jgi:hypothetical protein
MKQAGNTVQNAPNKNMQLDKVPVARALCH